jgi:hypothetical protein
MDKQAWSRPAIVAALALAAAMPLMMDAQAYPYGHRIGTGYQFAAVLMKARASRRRIPPMMAPSSSSA